MAPSGRWRRACDSPAESAALTTSDGARVPTTSSLRRPAPDEGTAASQMDEVHPERALDLRHQGSLECVRLLGADRGVLGERGEGVGRECLIMAADQQVPPPLRRDPNLPVRECRVHQISLPNRSVS